MASEIDGTSKGLLGGFALFILGSGIATLAYGILSLLRYLSIQYSYGICNLFVTSIILIVIGGLLIITVLLGAIGLWKGVPSVRIGTLVLAFVIFVVLIAIGVWTMFIVQGGRLRKSIDMDIKELNDKSKDLTPAAKAKADYLNRHYNCCGSYESYSAANGNENLPESCCIAPGCDDNSMTEGEKYFEKGCRAVYTDIKSKEVFQVSVFTLAAGGATLLGLILYAVIYQRRSHTGYAGVSSRG